MKATSEPSSIRVAVELAATSLFTPKFNHTGIRMRAPPMARVAPTSPAQNPTTIYVMILFALMFTLFFI